MKSGVGRKENSEITDRLVQIDTLHDDYPVAVISEWQLRHGIVSTLVGSKEVQPKAGRRPKVGNAVRLIIIVAANATIFKLNFFIALQF